MNEDDITIEEFCELHRACEERADWAKANCRDVRHAWETLPAEDLIWVATRPGVLDDRTLRLFACWCVRQVWHQLADERSRTAVEVAERFAAGDASDDELAAARAAAWDAAWATAGDAAWATAGAAAGAAASAAARAAAWDAATAAATAAASAAARDAARDAAWAAARNAAWAAARNAQAAWLREHAAPNFSRDWRPVEPSGRSG